MEESEKESILVSVKKMLGIPQEYTHFDADVIIHINSVFMILNQLGVGPPDGFSIEDETATWDDYIGDQENIESVRSYVYLRVRLLFDPPTSSMVSESMNHMVDMLEWRLNVAVDTPEDEEE